MSRQTQGVDGSPQSQRADSRLLLRETALEIERYYFLERLRCRADAVTAETQGSSQDNRDRRTHFFSDSILSAVFILQSQLTPTLADLDVFVLEEEEGFS